MKADVPQSGVHRRAVKPRQPVEVSLDLYPGQIFAGKG